jgi:hypothetical protein
MAVEDQTTPLGESAHDKAMVAKADALSGDQPSTPSRPDYVPEKFWDAEAGQVRVEDLLKSYTELEKAKSAPAQEPPADAAKTAEEAAKAAGADTSKVDFNALSAEFAQNGALSPEAYQKLESAGLNKDLVDQFIAGQVALAQVQTQEAYGLVGGEQQYTQMLDWAVKNLSKEDQAAFDRAVVADSASRKQAIVALKAQYEAAVGRDPKLVFGGSGNAATSAYQSRAEMVRDMSDPRYRNDPAFQKMVQQRLAVSDIF